MSTAKKPEGNYEVIGAAVSTHVRWNFTAKELEEHSTNLAKCVADKAAVENEKKVANAQFKEKLAAIDADMTKLAGYKNNGWAYLDRTCELRLNYDTFKREYVDKQTGDVVKEEDFRESDYQRKLEFEDDQLAQQRMINENNQAGDFANADPIDAVIRDRKLGVIHTDDDDITAGDESLDEPPFNNIGSNDEEDDQDDMFKPRDQE